MLNKCISGGYINFAICDFYQDDSFVNIASMVFKSILNQDITEIANYPKVNSTLYKFIEEFFKKHLELAFLKIDKDLIKQIFVRVLLPGMLSEVPDIKLKALTSIDCLNTFIFNNFKKPNKKMATLFENL